LSIACFGGNKDLARLLLDHGANIENCDVDGDTPLTLARNKGHRSLVNLLEDEREARARKIIGEYNAQKARYVSCIVDLFVRH
jgi:ankyrin repeat protein